MYKNSLLFFFSVGCLLFLGGCQSEGRGSSLSEELEQFEHTLDESSMKEMHYGPTPGG